MNFRTTTYAFRSPGAAAGSVARHQVVIIGAGPVGLTMALDLARRGVASVILETRDRVLEGSRATGISRRTLQVWDALGVSGNIMELALQRTGTSNRFYLGSDQVRATPYLHSSRDKFSPPTVMLQQCWIEQVLVERVLQTKLIDLRWHSCLQSLQTQPDGVDLQVATPEGEYNVSADYVIAADGAHSTTRKLLGLRYEGKRFSQRFVIIDFEMNSNLEGGRRIWFEPPYSPESTVILHKLPFNVWRLDALIPETVDDDQAASPSSAKQRVAAHLEMMGVSDEWRLVNSSLYQINALTLRSYSQGRVFFAGDAAHLTPIWSGRGMNHGIEDAANLSWKLASVLAGAKPQLLQTFTTERRESVMHTMTGLENASLYITAPTPALKLMRRAALKLSMHHEFAGALFDPHAIGDRAYSVLRLGDHQVEAFGPQPGALLPNARVRCLGSCSSRAGDDRPHDSYLHDLLGTDCTGLYFASDNNAHSTDWFDASWLDQTPLRMLVVGKVAVTHPSVRVLEDPFGDIRDTLCKNAPEFYLIRPDGRVAARWKNPSAVQVTEAVEIILGQRIHASPLHQESLQPPAAGTAMEEVFTAIANQLEKINVNHYGDRLAELALLLAQEVGDPNKVSAILNLLE